MINRSYPMFNHPTIFVSQAKKRQKEQFILMTFVALLLSLGVLLLVLGYKELSRTKGQNAFNIVDNAYAKIVVEEQELNDQTLNLREIIVPLENIKRGEKISFNKLTKKKILAEYASDAIDNFSNLVGAYSTETLYSGQAIKFAQITYSKPADTIVSQIPAGYRAVTITLTPTKSIEGWLQAGTNVDVYWITTRNKKALITPIVQNAYVLSADRNTVEHMQNAQNKRNVKTAIRPNNINNKVNKTPLTASLLVTKEDALKINLASSNGEITLSLRGEEEQGNVAYSSRGITTSDLLNKSVSVKEKAKPTVRIVDEKTRKVQKYYFKDGKLSPLA